MDNEKSKITHGYYCENCVHDVGIDKKIYCQNCSKGIKHYDNQIKTVDNFCCIDNKIIWKYNNAVYISRIGAQTFQMEFEFFDISDNTIYYNVVLGVYNKRKHFNSNIINKKITGTKPQETITEMRKAFNLLERAVLNRHNKFWNIIILVGWADNQRRDIYYRYLSRLGYSYQNCFGEKVIMKRYEKGEMCNE